MIRNSCATNSPIVVSASRVEEIEGYLAEAGLTGIRSERVPPAKGEAGKLTVALWIAEDPRVISDSFPKSDVEFA